MTCSTSTEKVQEVAGLYKPKQIVKLTDTQANFITDVKRKRERDGKRNNF